MQIEIDFLMYERFDKDNKYLFSQTGKVFFVCKRYFYLSENLKGQEVCGV